MEVNAQKNACKREHAGEGLHRGGGSLRMGASESTPAKASTEEEDLFTADELETLHAAFAAFW